MANDLTTPEIFGELARLTRLSVRLPGTTEATLDLLGELAERQHEEGCQCLPHVYASIELLAKVGAGCEIERAACLDAMKEEP